MSVTSSTQALPGISPDIYNDRDFANIARMAYEAVGIVFAQSKIMLVYSRLAPLVRRAGCKTFSAYLEVLRHDAGERATAIAALTTNHTSFYREAHHFKHFVDQVRPVLLRRLSAGKPVRLWSAACSSGEEVWSLVMALLGSDRNEGKAIAGSNLLVLATDIAPHVLAKAEAATYSPSDVAAVPEAIRSCWTEEVDGMITMDEVARSIVKFRQLNLIGEWPVRKQFQVIFCRNVMIYFDEHQKETMPARFAKLLEPDGHLYIGHSERVSGAAADILESVGPTIYRKVGR